MKKKTNNEVKLADIKGTGEDDYLISLTKLTGKKIKDIMGHVSNNFDSPVFDVTKIIFEDDSEIWVEGEHDMAYLGLGTDDQPNMDEDTLQRLYDEENKGEDEEEDDWSDIGKPADPYGGDDLEDTEVDNVLEDGLPDDHENDYFEDYENEEEDDYHFNHGEDDF